MGLWSFLSSLWSAAPRQPTPPPAPTYSPQAQPAGGSIGWGSMGAGSSSPAPTTTPTPAPAPAPAPAPTSGNTWRFFHSPGMPTAPNMDGEKVFFDFQPSPSEVDMVLKQTGPLGGRIRVWWKYEGGSVRPTQGSTPTVSVMFQRLGDDWTARGEKASYRWYWQGRPVVAGEHSAEIPFDQAIWSNVYGQKDPAGFAAAMTNAGSIGLAFGDPGAGATAHGVSGTGRFTFTFEVVP
jgi:hypothetical protein